MPNDQAPPDHMTEANVGGTGTLWAFTLATFLSALLLFSIQPMFAKMVLPVLGGSPSVWAVAMCFFQAALLIGYCYAHILITRFPARTSGFIHLAVCLLAFVALPIRVPEMMGEPPAGEPYLWQLGLFSVAVGLPFIAVAANAPLFQAWFAKTGHPQGGDPYFLYAASNLGSLIALLSYPFLLEPTFGVRALAGLWAIGFALLVLTIGFVFWLMRKSAASLASPAETSTFATWAARPTWFDRLRWIALAFVPSALLTAFTTHVTTDVASAPLLWVLPLALYLLTFVLVFRERALIPRPLLLALHLAAVVAALLLMSQTRNEGWFVTAPVGVLVFFTSAMVAHRTLFEVRPAAQYLTGFYLYMSLGGALGGLAAALLAPKVFNEIFEYPLLLALSMACRPGAFDFWPLVRRSKPQFDQALAMWLLAAVGILAVFWVPWLVERMPFPGSLLSGPDDIPSKAALWFTWPLAQLSRFLSWVFGWGATSLVAGLLAVILLLNWRHPPRQLMAALMMVFAITTLPSGVKRGDAQRSYFGVYRVLLSFDGQWNTLVHGTTLHGAQRVRDEQGNTVADISPATYYHSESPMAKSVVTMREIVTEAGRKGRYGVIGLGTGSLACHAAEGEAWRFFEIDPVVINIAAKSDSFTFIENCQPNPDIVVGDARLTLNKEADGSYDLIVVDAFSSDAVPVHLMTAEALAMYIAKLNQTGVALLHISNRYLDLDAVLAATTPLVPGVHGIIVSDDTSDGSYAQSTSTVALFAKSPEALERFRSFGTVSELDANGLRGWTDDYSDILGPFLSKYRKRFN